jgi:hypothetical protein
LAGFAGVLPACGGSATSNSDGTSGGSTAVSAGGSGAGVGLGATGGTDGADQTCNDACLAEATTITLQRSRCYGSCPAYSVTLTPDGLVSYEGEAYVLYHGAASHRIAPSAVRSLADEMESAHYFELSVPRDCADTTTDAPTVTTSLERSGRSHEIANYHGNGCAPPVLAALEQRIDEVAGTAVWITCPPADYCPNL